MRTNLLSYSAIICCVCCSLNGMAEEVPATLQTGFSAFTGKVTKNKVRVRLQPSLDGTILKELPKDELLVVVGETDDFFAVLPPEGTKGYVYRTYILDNVVEGTKVNVRSEPDLEAPIIAQLNNGERVDGSISALNSKWLEITAPERTKFYICKEYVERLGDSSLMSQLNERRKTVNELLNTAYLQGNEEISKEFQDIKLEPVLAIYRKIIQEYADFNEQASRAKELLASLQENYMHKKIAYLESKNSPQIAGASAGELLLAPQYTVETIATADPVPNFNNSFEQSIDNHWTDVEARYVQQWFADHPELSTEDFARDDEEKTVFLRGVVESNMKSVKNKPGDYILVNRLTRLPIAYLYGIDVQLQQYLGHEVSVQAVPRPNNHFAFPAYKVITVE